MTSTTETGHAKNVANFEQLITQAASLGAQYNPPRREIQLSALQSLSGSARGALDGVNAALQPYNNAVVTRATLFESLSPLSGRVLNFLKATDTDSRTDEDISGVVRKIQGRRASSKLTDEEKKTLAAEGKSVKEISTSQMSYDSRLENFNKLIQQLASIPQYAPNETELQTGSLTALYGTMKQANDAVVQASVALSGARAARDRTLYAENTGLVAISVDVKNYIKAVFGASSVPYKQVSQLTFATAHT